MAGLVRDRQYNFRVNAQLLEQAKIILSEKDMTLSDALNLFVERVVEEQDLPIKTVEEVRAEAFLDELIAELDEGYQEVLSGHTTPAREVFAKYGL
ncbi:TPA: type II toxin-antitoxin system RelB/DinJ family antitoxin [Streptococcus suis]|uniref:Acyl-ACP desaturase n=3 Tax=Streptococcus TaxID=1301 RepID=A0A116RME5_STRSU|nr:MULTISPECIES: type II toxin-antitoxin system RelB/DinJ family antitoxin [Streptococcus]MCK3890354.1 acyl-ACP desaturase [Streptococcus suis]MCK4024823.1 acyl-ACP desaturase [Streptococcus suis]NQK80668.1 acyl-ACP desaturase [Streptococcus suis]NQM07006.1 acyl-ACP desaturase [Streptococcus suis]NQM50280.1 acyl-ACP desaturase [Streptococcus suis]